MEFGLLKEDGTYAAPGELGELVILPPEDAHQYGIFSGYLNDDALYRYVWRGGAADGWWVLYANPETGEAL